MILNRYALLWLASLVPAHAQWEFLEATKESIPLVEVPKEEVIEKVAILQNDYGGEVVVASEIWKKLPMPADDFPENLKGVLWMDQFGDYGYENVTTTGRGAGENLLTFGDAHLDVLDTDTRTQWVGGMCGGAWTIDPIFKDNSAQDVIYPGFCEASKGGRPIIFQFVWNEDYTVSNVYSFDAAGDMSSLGYIASMVKVPDQPEGTCPPAEDATKEERNLCAKFIRGSFQEGEGGNPNAFVYPVFEIVGADGVPREPYYSAFLDWMERKNTTMQNWRPLKATMDPMDAGNAFNISLTDAPAGTTDAPATAAPSAATTAVVNSALALLLGAAVMMV